jgi:hypothetical protein
VTALIIPAFVALVVIVFTSYVIRRQRRGRLIHRSHWPGSEDAEGRGD